MYTYEQVEQYIKNTIGDIYFGDHKGIILGQNIEQVLCEIMKITSRQPTFRGDNIYCYRYDRRSLGEIYMLVCHHYKYVTLEECHKTLIELIRNNKLGSWICPSADKRMYLDLQAHSETVGFINGDKDEYGWEYKHYDISSDKDHYGEDISASLLNIKT